MSSCCGTRPDDQAPEHCPRCGEKGRSVGRETVASMAAVTVPAPSLSLSDFSLCQTESCAAVYFAGGGTVLEEKDVRVPVNWKDAGPDVPLCYCFSHTRRTISDEIAETGHSSAFATITDAVKAGQCACDVKNPSGTCCLGDIRKYEREVSASRDPATSDDKGVHHE